MTDEQIAKLLTPEGRTALLGTPHGLGFPVHQGYGPRTIHELAHHGLTDRDNCLTERGLAVRAALLGVALDEALPLETNQAACAREVWLETVATAAIYWRKSPDDPRVQDSLQRAVDRLLELDK